MSQAIRTIVAAVGIAALAVAAGTLGVLACTEDEAGEPGIRENTPELCSNGLDDDLNGWSDCADSNCFGLSLCRGDADVVEEAESEAEADAGDAEIVEDVEDAGDAEDGEVFCESGESCVGEYITECLPDDQIRQCVEGCWEYHDCWTLCDNAGQTYIDECGTECWGGAFDRCCCV